MPILIKLDLTKIDKSRIFEGKKGKYLDLILMDNRDGTDQYGNDGFCAHSLSKEEREAGVKGPIVGNFKHLGEKPVPRSAMKPVARASRPSAPPSARDPDLDPSGDDDIPF